MMDGELARLRAAIEAARSELVAVHHPDGDGRLCVVCGPADGSWPCVTHMVADELAAAAESGS